MSRDKLVWLFQNNHNVNLIIDVGSIDVLQSFHN